MWNMPLFLQEYSDIISLNVTVITAMNGEHHDGYQEQIHD